MESLFWQLTNRTAETLLILNVFHLLLAGLMLMILVRQRRHGGVFGSSDRLVTLGATLLVIHFSALTLRFSLAFFFQEQVHILGIDRVSHALLIAAVLAIVAGYLDSAGGTYLRFLLPAFPALVLVTLVDSTRMGMPDSTLHGFHSPAVLGSNVLAMAALGMAIWLVVKKRCPWEGRGTRILGMMCWILVLALDCVSPNSGQAGALVWNASEHLLSIALFAMTWAVGERSHHLFDRVFVRLNLTFLVLASLIMMITAGMQKYQYFRLAEQRSVNLAEFVRGHVTYYGGQGETLEQIFRHPEVLRRVIAEFGNLPELREVEVSWKGQRASFQYGRDFEVRESITSLSPESEPRSPISYELHNEFSMISLPLHVRRSTGDVILIGTLDYVNAYIGKYIIFIYCAFTIMVGLGTIVIGMIVADADRQLHKQYSELHQAQQRLAQSAKLASIGALAGGMAHEINNPITGILALASHMAEGNNAGALNARGRRNLEVIVRQTERVANLVRGLLTFSRQTQLHLGEVHLDEVIETALDLVRYRLNDERVKDRLQLESALPTVIADSSRLTEVFVNLLGNALDAMPSGGTLTITARRLPRQAGVQIEVQDTGEGIAPELLARVFDPFFTTKAPGRGTGLGLSISHGIVKDHGGEIWAQSSVGMGTTMVVVLPLEVTGAIGVAERENASISN
jgi:signal transduction histidine kinase